MRGERGQATVEWVALVLVVSLVLVAAGLGVRGSARGAALGGALSERIVCGARSVGGSASRCASRARTSARRSASSASAAPPLARTADAFQRLRGFSQVAKRVWVVCLGYKRWRYELEHPRTLRDPMPVDEALRIANACFNPLDFLGAG
jgi:hypothetical protein